MKFFDKIRQCILAYKRLISVGMLSIALPFMAASESSLKSLIDEYFNGCEVYIDVSKIDNNGIFFVRLSVVGNPPQKSILTISSDEKIFSSVRYTIPKQYDNLALHPDIKGWPNSDSHDDIGIIPGIEIKPFDKYYSYFFEVKLKEEFIEQVKSGSIYYGAALSFPADERATCKVESVSIFSWLVGQNSTGRFVFLLFFVFFVTVLVAGLRKE